MFDWLKKAFGPEPEQKGYNISTLLDLIDRGEKSVDSGRFHDLVNAGYKKNGVVFSAVNLVASSVGAIPWLLYRKDSDGQLIQIRNHPILKLIERPNRLQSGARFFEQMMIYLLVGGSNYILKTDSSEGITIALNNLRPDLVKLKNKRDPDKGYIYTPDPDKPEDTRLYRPEDVLALHIIDPLDEFSGLSPIQVASLTIDQGNYSRIWNKNLLQNNARPAGLLRAVDNVYNLSREQIEEIEARFSAKYTGMDNAGRIPVLTGSLDWVSTSMSPGEMEWIEGQKVADRLTSVTLRVASQLLGDTEASTFSNYQEARKSLYQENILPTLTWIKSELNAWLVSLWGDDFIIDYDRGSIDALQEDRSIQWRRIADADWLTINEKREATGFEKIDTDVGSLIITARGVIVDQAGNVTLGPSSLAPLGEESDEEETAPARVSPSDEGEEEEEEETSIDISKIRPKFDNFNLSTEEDAIAHFKAFDEAREQFYSSFQIAAQASFDKQRTELVGEIKKAGSDEAIDALISKLHKEQLPLWREFYMKLYMEVGEYFARRTIQSLASKVHKPSDKLKYLATCTNWKDEEEIHGQFSRRVTQYLADDSSRKIIGITEATRDFIKSQLVLGVAAGEGIPELAARIDGRLEQTYAHRAETVARTEVINASNAGAYWGALETGVVKRKQWLSIMDTRTRDNHMTANMQTVDFPAPFMVGGSMLMWPGDSSQGAPAQEVINCRCTLLFLTK